ncbi:unnamed protein product [Owenia fusiformis]|uniref:Uncharacterized protein n=1 Tax=Owenia fusiformis TaxID=6347 RepID=A0A8J1TVK3_OWEFU|nr:unnamed protein product [Owenia fusiformis]
MGHCCSINSHPHKEDTCTLCSKDKRKIVRKSGVTYIPIKRNIIPGTHKGCRQINRDDLNRQTERFIKERNLYVSKYTKNENSHTKGHDAGTNTYLWNAAFGYSPCQQSWKDKLNETMERYERSRERLQKQTDEMKKLVSENNSKNHRRMKMMIDYQEDRVKSLEAKRKQIKWWPEF